MPTGHAQAAQILVLVDTSTTWGSEVIRGIDEYARTQSQWLLIVESRGVEETPPIPAKWHGQGVIARVTQQALARQLTRLKLPVVNVSWSFVPSIPFPRVISSETEVARLAAAHLLDRGYRHFAYCGIPRQSNYIDSCVTAFGARVQEHGFPVHVFEPSRKRKPPWEAVSVDGILNWLKSLPKPVAVLAWGPERGRNVTDACRAGGLRVPDEVAVVTTTDDELLCGISHPPLSAVDDRPRVVGYQAAALLARLMDGAAIPRVPILISPSRVIARHSTDGLALEDHDVASALRFIRQRYAGPISVSDILRAVPLSRRALEQRFLAAIGRSPAAEIRHVRLERVKELLVSSTWSIDEIARSTGFSESAGMIRVFRREVGMTPGHFRKLAQVRRDQP